MLKLIVFLMPIFFFGEGKNQPVCTITEKHDFFTVDEFGNIYTVSENEIKKFNTEGVLQRSFSRKGFGSVASVDVSNPMKILVFYREFSTVIFLDNTLSINGGPVNLAEPDASQAQLACTSHENGFWVFDPVSSRLMRFDYSLQQQITTGDLRQLLQKEINPVCLLEDSRSVYMADTSGGIIVFDMYGGYLKTIPLKNVSRFQVSDHKLYYIKENQLMSFGLKSLEENSFKPEVAILKFFHIGNNRLIVSDGSEIIVFPLK